MQVKGISDTGNKSVGTGLLNKTLKNSEPLTINTVEEDNIVPTNSIINNYLTEALDFLDNNIQVNDNNPLDKSNSSPINSYNEALNEITFINSDKFKSEASNVQANIKADDILSLFVNSQ